MVTEQQELLINHDAHIGYSQRLDAAVFFSQKTDPQPTVAPEEKTSEKVALWGANNDFPQIIEREIKKNPDLGTVLDWQARALYAGGLTYKVMVEDKEGNATYKDRVIPEIEAFLKRNMQYRTHAPVHFYKFFNVFPEFTLSLDRSQIIALTAKKPTQARFGLQNSKTKLIDILYLSSRWTDGAGPDDPDTVKIPVIDPSVYTAELLRMRNDNLHYIYPISYPGEETYYTLAKWDSIRQSKWLELANSIPEFKIALMKNQLSIKYHIQMPDYWMSWKFPDYEALKKKDPKKAKALVNGEIKKFEDFLVGIKNAGKSITSVFKTDNLGKPWPGWNITAIDDKLKDGAYLEDSVEATMKIYSAVGVDPALAGITPGKSGNSRNGSDKREALNIYLSLCQMHEDLILQPYYFISDYNGWTAKHGHIVWSFIKPYMQTLNQVTPSKRETGYEEDSE